MNQKPTRKHPQRSTWGIAALVLLAAAVVLASTPQATAHNGNVGTIKVHDSEQVDTPQSNDPHVTCQFWIQGFGMDGDEGTLVFIDWPPTGNKDIVMDDDWFGTPDGNGGFDFLNGPYSLPPGHYRVEAYSTDGHPGNHGHFAKSKMFWVDPCDDVPELRCPTDLTAIETENGNILVNFTPAPGSDGTNIYRSVNGGPFDYLDTLAPAATQYLDTDANPLTGYAYYVTALYDDRESQDCPITELRTIPVFPGVFAGVMAAVVGVVAYGGLRRKT